MTFPWSTALVTGASSGIGWAIAEQLASAGVATVAVARRGDRLEALRALHPSVEPLVADLLTAEGRAAVVGRLTATAQPIELLVNNAGFGADGAVVDVEMDKALGMVELNIRALTELTKAALPRMTADRRGWILQVSSVASFQPLPTAAIYSATKAYVTSFSEALHEELRGTGVNVCALCPGFTETEFHEVSGANPASALPGVAWLTAERVAASGLRAVAAGRALDTPGLLYKSFGAVMAVTPRRVVRRLVGIGARTQRR